MYPNSSTKINYIFNQNYYPKPSLSQIPIKILNIVEWRRGRDVSSSWGLTWVSQHPQTHYLRLQHPLPDVSPLETIWTSSWGPIWALYLTLCHGDHHNNIANTTIDPSQPPPPPVWGFTATQHTHKSKPTHHPKLILCLHWSIKLHGRAWELNPQNLISKHSIGKESLSKKKESTGG